MDKVRLKKDWFDFVEGYETVINDENDTVEFSSVSEESKDNETVTSYSFHSFNRAFIENNPDLFEIVPEKPKVEAKNPSEIEEKLADIYKDIELLKTLDTKNTDKYIHTLENMAYILEWALGKVN